MRRIKQVIVGIIILLSNASWYFMFVESSMEAEQLQVGLIAIFGLLLAIVNTVEMLTSK